MQAQYKFRVLIKEILQVGMRYPLGKGISFCCFICFQMFATQLSADYYRFLTTEQEALQCRFDLINGAQTEILISCYIIKDDETGMAIMSALLEARLERGVRVCILMDGSASKINPNTVGYLTERGIEIKEFYLEKAAGVKRYYHRLHDKTFLVDGKKMILGGRNIKNEYYELDCVRSFKDRDVYVESFTAGAVGRRHFYYMWNAKKLTSRVYKRKPSEQTNARIEAEILRAKELISNCTTIDLKEQSDWSIGLEPTESPVVFIHDHFMIKRRKKYIDSYNKDAGSTDALIDLLERAEEFVFLENPYVVPTRKWNRALKNARARGIRITILTNSIKSNDILISQAAYMNRRRKLIKMGIEIWEHQGPKCFHAKTATIDDQVSMTGSYNIHTPSERFNSEVAVWVKDQNIAIKHRENIQEYMKEAVLIGPNNKPVATSFPNYKQTSFKRRAITFGLRYSVSWILGRVL